MDVKTKQLIEDIERDVNYIQSFLKGKTKFVITLNADGIVPMSKDGRSILGKYK